LQLIFLYKSWAYVNRKTLLTLNSSIKNFLGVNWKSETLLGSNSADCWYKNNWETC